VHATVSEGVVIAELARQLYKMQLAKSSISWAHELMCWVWIENWKFDFL